MPPTVLTAFSKVVPFPMTLLSGSAFTTVKAMPMLSSRRELCA
jgi:hypothetical protein